ncbi:MAG: Nif3-like dinuclear metal center hexameric protein [Candidatus Woesearchaeota archaeon]|nr:Nif3-like dinuclear metal center hexameric protein [Candidatus Woesearchaeota archaeon]
MADARKIAKFLNRELSVRKIPDISRNGLQFNSGRDVKKIGFSEDACIETFRKAKRIGCQMLIVHHGILWKGDYAKGITKRRRDFLKNSRLSLYAAHLPLDYNIRFGNNIALAHMLGLRSLRRFGRYSRTKIGFIGRIERPTALSGLVAGINKKLKTKCIVLPFGKKRVSSVAIVSGGAAEKIYEAAEQGADLYLTGEAKLSSYHYAKELKINMVAAGHYATETLGVKALMPILRKRFNVRTVFIENRVNL